MKKPLLLDLFCGAGGCSMGYHRAGFDVIGVDLKPQPNYPFKFVQGDATKPPLDLSKFDAIHASPPCQEHSRLRSLGVARNGSYGGHVDLIGDTRRLLETSGKPYVIENVPGAPLRKPITLCGRMFKLRVYRHRWFEHKGFVLSGKDHPTHRDKTPSAGWGMSPKGFISVCGNGGVKGLNSAEIVDVWSRAMNIDWMSRAELAQAIPPAYTEWIGKQLLEQVH